MCVCLWDHARGCGRNSSDTVTEGQRNMATAARKSQQGNVTRFLPYFNTHERTNTYTAQRCGVKQPFPCSLNNRMRTHLQMNHSLTSSIIQLAC